MAVVQTLRLKNMPAGVRVVHGVAPFPAGVDVSTLALHDGIEYRPTQAQRIGQNGKWDIVEINAHVVIPSGGNHTYDIHDVVPPTLASVGAEDYRQNALDMVFTSGVVLRLWDTNNQPHDLNLGVPMLDDSLHRSGALRTTVRRFADLGMFGAMVWWLTIEVGRSEVQVHIDWNNGTGVGRPHAVFKSVEVVLPVGWAWTPYVPEDQTYDVPNNRMVRDEGINQALFTRYSQPFRFVINETTDTPNANSENTGWGAFDWTGGGWYPAGWKLSNSLPTSSVSDRDYEIGRLNPLQSAPREGGGIPPSIFYPAYFIEYGGGTSGNLLWTGAGAMQASDFDRRGLKFWWIAQRRDQSRQFGVLYDDQDAGRPVDPSHPRWLDANGDAQWDSYNNQFQYGGGIPKEGNWNWEVHTGTPASPAVPYETDLMGIIVNGRRFFNNDNGTGITGYDPHDYQHLIRHTRVHSPLVWLDWDPLAWHYLQAASRVAWMAYWEGTGNAAGRFNIPAAQGRGGLDGRDLHWVTHVRSQEYVFATGTMRNKVRAWLEHWVDQHEQALMPVGFCTYSSGKSSTSPPFNSEYVTSRFNEFCYESHSAEAVSQVLSGSSHGDRALALVTTMAAAVWDFVWEFNHINGVQQRNDPTTGCWDTLPVGTAVLVDGIPFMGTPYNNSDEWPPDLVIEMEQDPNKFTAADTVAPSIAILYRLTKDRVRAANILSAWLNMYPSSDFDAMRTVMEGWGVTAPGQQTSPHVSQWAGLLGALQNPDPEDGADLMAAAGPASFAATGVVTRIATLAMQSSILGDPAQVTVVRIATVDAISGPAGFSGTAGGAADGTLSAVSGPATFEGTAETGNADSQLFAVSGPAQLDLVAERVHPVTAALAAGDAEFDGTVDSASGALLNAVAGNSTLASTASVVRVADLIAAAEAANAPMLAAAVRTALLDARAAGALFTGVGETGDPFYPPDNTIVIEVERLTLVRVYRQLLELQIVGSGISNLAPFLLVVYEADGAQVPLRLIRPSDVPVYEASGSQALLDTDGVELTVYESDGSQAQLPLVPIS